MAPAVVLTQGGIVSGRSVVLEAAQSTLRIRSGGIMKIPWRVTLVAFMGVLGACANEGKVATTYDAAGYVGGMWGKHDRALEGFREVVAMRPNLPEGHYNEGVALANLGRWSEALAAFRKATALKPGLVQAHLGAGVALARLGRTDEASAEFRSAGRPDGAPVSLRDVPYCMHYHKLPNGC